LLEWNVVRLEQEREFIHRYIFIDIERYILYIET
jgi:hypothetical protein